MKKDRHLPFFKKNGKYKNPYSKGLKYGLFDIVLWKTGFYKEKMNKVPLDFSSPFKVCSYDKKKPNVTWINHSTFLIEINDIRILTDPVWSKKCSPFKLIGPSRKHKPAFPIDQTPKVDFVLISHNHYDHLDGNSVKILNKLNPDIKWIVPKGLKKWFVKKSIFNVYELDWWNELTFNDFVITSVPAQHFSGRSMIDYNNTLWSGYVVEEKKTSKCVYFAGDTGYNEHDFKEIGKNWNKIDLSLIPIGAYMPRGFMRSVHIDPYEAVKIHKDVNSALSIGMHWKTFKLSDEPSFLPPYDLYLAMKKENLCYKSFITVEPGAYVNW
jgi:L-ascorbate metabolism protein UlaG (beta-lactamase superfamily)